MKRNWKRIAFVGLLIVSAPVWIWFLTAALAAFGLLPFEGSR